MLTMTKKAMVAKRTMSANLKDGIMANKLVDLVMCMMTRQFKSMMTGGYVFCCSGG